jgi:ABC-type Fe3+/spermidine/putrescine transport system ATPase subunit
VAEFIGRANWFEGRLGEPVAPGLHEFVTPEGRFVVRCGPSANGEIAQLCVRPERLRMLAMETKQSGELNVVVGTVSGAIYLGSEIHHAVVLDSGRTVICVEQNLDQPLPTPGTRIAIGFRPTDCILTS